MQNINKKMIPVSESYWREMLKDPTGIKWYAPFQPLVWVDWSTDTDINHNADE
jgi:hypothetical protein